MPSRGIVKRDRYSLLLKRGEKTINLKFFSQEEIEHEQDTYDYLRNYPKFSRGGRYC